MADAYCFTPISWSSSGLREYLSLPEQWILSITSESSKRPRFRTRPLLTKEELCAYHGRGGIVGGISYSLGYHKETEEEFPLIQRILILSPIKAYWVKKTIIQTSPRLKELAFRKVMVWTVPHIGLHHLKIYGRRSLKALPHYQFPAEVDLGQQEWFCISDWQTM